MPNPKEIIQNKFSVYVKIKKQIQFENVEKPVWTIYTQTRNLLKLGQIF